MPLNVHTTARGPSIDTGKVQDHWICDPRDLDLRREDVNLALPGRQIANKRGRVPQRPAPHSIEAMFEHWQRPEYPARLRDPGSFARNCQAHRFRIEIITTLYFELWRLRLHGSSMIDRWYGHCGGCVKPVRLPRREPRISLPLRRASPLRGVVRRARRVQNRHGLHPPCQTARRRAVCPGLRPRTAMPIRNSAQFLERRRHRQILQIEFRFPIRIAQEVCSPQTARRPTTNQQNRNARQFRLGH